DAHAGHLLDGLDHTGRTDLGVDGVEHHTVLARHRRTVGLGAVGPGHQRVAGYGHRDGLVTTLRNVHDQRRVGPRPADPGTAAQLLVLRTGPRVGAEDQQV